MEDKDKKKELQNKKKKQTAMTIIVTGIASIICMLFMTSMFQKVTTKEITYNEFIGMLENEEIEKVEFNDKGKITIKPVQDEDALVKITYWTAQLNDEELISDLRNKYTSVEFKGTFTSAGYSILSYVLPFVFMYGIFFYFIRKIGKSSGGVMNVGKSTAKMYMERETGVTFRDVAGQDEAKESLTELVDFLHEPQKYTRIGAKLPKGALLVGPPGTGKTLLAKAVAGEAKVPFFSLSGSDFVEMFVGVGASRVRDLFKEAQKMSPCIIFIDEIDAIGKSRDSKFGGNDEREQTLNQLLSEMDGFDSSKAVLILGATNRPEVLDQALLRPGRFDRRVIVDKPDLKGREETLRVHSKVVAMDDTVDLNAIALATAGSVGSDLANMINEAAISAVKHGRNAISQADLFESFEVVIAGKEKKDRVLGKEEKRAVAYHETGHALVAALQKDSEPVQKITIVPRTMGSLGYVMQIPEEEKYLMNKDELNAELVMLLAGRAAEEISLDSVTTGASNDMEKATKIARAMIAQYGMSDKFGLMSLETVENQYLSGGTRLNCSDSTSAEVDIEVKQMLTQSYDKAKKLLLENQIALNKITDYLYEKETITGAQFMEILRRVQSGEDVSVDSQEPEKVLVPQVEEVEPLVKHDNDSVKPIVEFENEEK